MDLALSPDQQAIRDEARRFLAASLTREHRLAWDATDIGHDPLWWDRVVALGWQGFALPDDVGGQGASLADVGILLEECGRAVAPMAVVAGIFGGLALDALGTAAQRRAWLPRVVRGAARVGVAVAERDAALEPSAFVTALRDDGGRLVLRGEKRFVLQGVTADVFLVAARDGDGVSFVLVRRDAPGVRLEPSSTLGKDRQSTLRLDDVAVTPADVAADRGAAWARWQRLRRTLVALTCSTCVGGADAVLDMTVRYVGEREQFGARIGTFQAVQQMAAVMAIQLEGARHATRQAVWLLGAGVPAEREVAVAAAWSLRAYREICLTAHQLHGGAGYVVEHELHRHTLRAKECELLFGSPEVWLEELAQATS